jgi:2-Cys peroxiredoxin 5
VVNPVAEGSALPHIDVYDEELNSVDICTLFAGKKGVLFGVPGAFTPTCSKSHVPGYIQDREALTAKGIDVVVCISVNDMWTMQAWAKDTGAAGRVRMMADQSGALSRALGVADGRYVEGLGSVRCRRFAMLVEDNVITSVKVEEPSGSGATCSFAPDILTLL